MAFENENLAAIARGTLLAEGFSEDDVTRFTKEEVIAECEKSIEQAANPVQLGREITKIREYIPLAKAGCGFLVVRAVEDGHAKKAVAIVRPYGLKFAEKYNRLTLEELA
jgi:hypothetical protein